MNMRQVNLNFLERNTTRNLSEFYSFDKMGMGSCKTDMPEILEIMLN
jgi:hypothetical protein